MDTYFKIRLLLEIAEGLAQSEPAAGEVGEAYAFNLRLEINEALLACHSVIRQQRTRERAEMGD